METAQLLGNFGEFIGAIAVVATLVYLALQVRASKAAVVANTRAMDENRRAMTAQTAQARIYRLAERREKEAESDHIARIMVKLELAGFPEDLSSVATLDALDKRRIRSWFVAYRALLQNSAYQIELGYENDELQGFFRRHVVRQFKGPMKALGIEPTGESLIRILAEEGQEEAYQTQKQPGEEASAGLG